MRPVPDRLQVVRPVLPNGGMEDSGPNAPGGFTAERRAHALKVRWAVAALLIYGTLAVGVARFVVKVLR